MAAAGRAKRRSEERSSVLRGGDVAWYKVDDQLHTHPKARRAGLAAMGLWTLAGSHSMCYLTDGFVEAWFVDMFPEGRELAGRLVEAGMWLPVDGGWQFHDWADYQPTRESVQAEREAANERKRRWKEKRDAERAAEQAKNAGGTRSETRSEREEERVENTAPTPTPTPTPQSSVKNTPAVAGLFERAYEAWPKKAERKRSFEKFQQLAKKHDPEWLAGEIIRFGAAYAVATEKRFVPALVVWLNGERWTDELPTPEKAVLDQQWSQALSSVDPCAVEHKWTVDGTCARCVARKETA